MNPDLQLLDDALAACTNNSVWCVEENSSGFIPRQYNGSIMGNRFDIQQTLSKKFPHVFFNDFDFSQLDTTAIDCLVFRIAKEKAINQHIVEQMFLLAQPHTKLILIGYKNEGILSLASKIQSTYTCEIRTEKHKGQLQQIDITLLQNSQLCPRLNETPYNTITKLNINGLAFFSKPGVFGWNKIDRGSELLAAYLHREKWGTDNKSVLDLGCGYGYLSIQAKMAGFLLIDATDNNAAAITACRKNFEEYHIAGEVFADNHAQHCKKKYDLILCNPPFHKGFDHDKKMIELFVTQAYAMLKAGGIACFVTNQFIGIEKIAATCFKKCELIEQKDGFKVIKLEKN